MRTLAAFLVLGLFQLALQPVWAQASITAKSPASETGRIATKLLAKLGLQQPPPRTEQFINESENYRQIGESMRRFWFTDQPTHMTPERVKFGLFHDRSEKPKTRIFEVGDLVRTPLPIPGSNASDKSVAANAHTLMKFVVAMAEPGTWERDGFSGTIEFIAESESLCITNSPVVLAEVEKVLAGLRRTNPK